MSMFKPSAYDPAELERVRMVLEWSLDDVTEKGKLFGLDVSKGTWVNWLTGKTPPAADKLDLICMTFGIDMDRLYPRGGHDGV